MVHGLINWNQLELKKQVEEHKEIFNEWITKIRDNLVTLYGMEQREATALALGGLYDHIFKVDKDGKLTSQLKPELDAFSTQNYGISLQEAFNIQMQYGNGHKGTPCR
jgi:hypothetical protein